MFLPRRPLVALLAVAMTTCVLPAGVAAAATQERLMLPGPDDRVSYGFAADVHGSTAVVADPFRGTVTVHQLPDGDPVTLTGDGSTAGAGFGAAVAVHADTIAVSVPPAGDTPDGGLLLFDRDADGMWTAGQLVAVGSAPADVAVHEDLLVVGEPAAAGGRGAVEVFWRTDGSFIRVGSVVGTEPGGGLGLQVDAAEGRFVAGAPNAHGNVGTVVTGMAGPDGPAEAAWLEPSAATDGLFGLDVAFTTASELVVAHGRERIAEVWTVDIDGLWTAAQVIDTPIRPQVLAADADEIVVADPIWRSTGRAETLSRQPDGTWSVDGSAVPAAGSFAVGSTLAVATPWTLVSGKPSGEPFGTWLFSSNALPVATDDDVVATSHLQVPGDLAGLTSLLTDGPTFHVPAPGLLGNDTDADGDPLTAVGLDLPDGVEVHPDGSVDYRPGLTGLTGTVTFTYVAADPWERSTPATVTLTVAG